jgi:hypothetical protein
MRKKFMIAAVAALTGVVYAGSIFGQEKKTFEGNIRAATYNNVAESVSAATNKSSRDNGVGGLIAKRVVTNKTSALLNEVDGYSEVLMKIKGNKVVTIDVKNGAMVLADGDKQEVYAIYPSIKSGIKYTFQEYAEMVIGAPKSIEQLPDSIMKVLDYECKKEIITSVRTMVVSGRTFTFTSTNQSWYTDQITLPPAYYSTGSQRSGLSMYSRIKAEEGDSYSTTEVTEIEEVAVPDEAFTIPSDCEFVDMLTLGKRQLKMGKGKNKKKQPAYTVGGKIPDTFWDF